MAVTTLSKILDKERNRIVKARDSLSSKIAALSRELAEYEAELQAILAYKSVKSGKRASVKDTRQEGKASTLKESVLSHLTAKPGLTRSELIDLLGIRGQKGKEQTLSNLLSRLKKTKVIQRTDGRYSVQKL